MDQTTKTMWWYRKEVKRMASMVKFKDSQILGLREEIDKLKKVNQQTAEVRKFQLIDKLSQIIDSNAHLTQFVAKICEPGTF